MEIKDFEIGKVYIRDDLISAFGGSFMRGMNYCSKTNSLVLISKHLKNRIYGDEWQNGLMIYTGEGQKGDQTMTGGNKRLNEAIQNNLPVYLFEVFEPHKYTYYGLVELAAESYFDDEDDVEGNARKVIRFPLRRVSDVAAYSEGISIVPTLNVVGAAISDCKGKMLVAQRGSGKLKGKWEFPGGKIEEGEFPEDALKREIKEELGVDVVVKRKIDDSFYPYEECNVNLSVYACELISPVSAVKKMEHQDLQWVNPRDFDSLDWAAADDPIKDTIIEELPLEIEEEVHFSYFETKPATPSEKETLRSVQDYEKSAKKKQQAGETAEQAVLKYEKDKLYNAGRPDLADNVRQVSKESSDYGYDVFSYEIHDGIATEAHIEVKSAKRSGKYIEFFISENELSKFKTDKAYKIYCLIRYGKSYKLHEVNKSEFRSDYLTPLTYKVRIRVEE